MIDKIVARSTANYQPPTTIFIVGPTASGKSKLAMDVARKYNGEIICADSQTLRKHLNIGTAKPSLADQQEIPHYMLDCIEPYDEFSVTQFQKLAKKHIVKIHHKGKLPIIVGGSGLYIDSLYFQYDLKEDKSKRAYKQELQALSVEALQQTIIDKGLVIPTNSRNPRHLIGVLLRNGKIANNRVPLAGSIIVGIIPDQNLLDRRISERIDTMFVDGLIDEVSSVVEKYGDPPSRFDAIGYPLVKNYLDGNESLDQTKELLRIKTRQYAKRQTAWFKRNTYISWHTTGEDAFKKIEQLLSK